MNLRNMKRASAYPKGSNGVTNFNSASMQVTRGIKKSTSGQPWSKKMVSNDRRKLDAQVWLPWERKPEEIHANGWPLEVVLVCHAIPRMSFQSKTKLLGLTSCISAQRSPLQHWNRKAPRTMRSNGSVLDVRILRSHCTMTQSGSGRLSFHWAGFLVCIILDINESCTQLRHSIPKWRTAQRKDFTTDEQCKKTPSEDRARRMAISVSASSTGVSFVMSNCKEPHVVANWIKDWKYLAKVVAAKLSKILATCWSRCIEPSISCRSWDKGLYNSKNLFHKVWTMRDVLAWATRTKAAWGLSPGAFRVEVVFDCWNSWGCKGMETGTGNDLGGPSICKRPMGSKLAGWYCERIGTANGDARCLAPNSDQFRIGPNGSGCGSEDGLLNKSAKTCWGLERTADARETDPDNLNRDWPIALGMAGGRKAMESSGGGCGPTSLLWCGDATSGIMSQWSSRSEIKFGSIWVCGNWWRIN